MKTLIVGGSYEGKESGVVKKIKDHLCPEGNFTLYNGVIPENVSGYELVVWMPDIPNGQEKNYPVKDKGAILICSKVMREGYTLFDAVTRIFKMHGNAVIVIYKEPGKNFRFELVDALANIWYSGDNISMLCKYITELCEWTKAAIRVSIPKAHQDVSVFNIPPLDSFIDINRHLAYKSATQCGNRYFGNFSTRCTKLFPSHRGSNFIVMSPRNVDKRTLTADDMVQIVDGAYIGDRKPSVDAPVQLAIYDAVPEINYMIHGHAYVEGVPTTEHYFPCGDMREVADTVRLLKKGYVAINLRNHGFLLATKDLGEMDTLKEKLNFRKIYNF